MEYRWIGKNFIGNCQADKTVKVISFSEISVIKCRYGRFKSLFERFGRVIDADCAGSSRIDSGHD